MDRREFISSSCVWCLGAAAVPLITGCATVYYEAAIDGSDLVVPLDAFSPGDTPTRSYLIVENERLLYPICLFRRDADSYRALWLRCTHQGGTLQVIGDELECPSHGSVFDHEGAVLQGPADWNLRTFPVRKEGGILRISLK